MNRYDTDLWSFLKDNDEKSLGISERLKLATKFCEKFEEIVSKNVFHRDYKPSNVLLNLTPDQEWNGQMEITDFGIAELDDCAGESAGTSRGRQRYGITVPRTASQKSGITKPKTAG